MFRKTLIILAMLFAILGSGAEAWGQTRSTATLPNTQALTTSFANVGNDSNIQIKTSSANSYTNPLRFYANVTATINAIGNAKITSITYEASSTGNYVTCAKDATVTPQATPTVSGKNVTWSYSAGITEFTFTPSTQTRCNSITIEYTIGSSATLESIEVTAAPTKVTYTEGEYFDPAGLVITKYFDDETTSDLAYDGNETAFSFNPTLTTPLATTNTQVEITVGGKSANQAITVNAAPKYTITFMDRTNQVDQREINQGAAVGELPEDPDDIGTYKFQGWAEQFEGTVQDAPAFVTSATIPTSDMTYYAVYAEVSGSGESTTESSTIEAIALANSWQDAQPYSDASFGNITVTGSGTGNNRKYYTSDKSWRFYSSGDGKITFTVPEDNFISNVALTGTSYFTSAPTGWNYSNNTFTPESGTNSNTITISNGNGTSKITAFSITYGGGETYSNYTQNPVAKTLVSIEVSGTPAEFWKGDAFNHNGMTVTANWDDESQTDVTADCEFSTPDMTTAGEKEITVTYQEQSDTYTINVQTIANTLETAYTVEEAKTLIDAGKDLGTEVYVKGTVSKVDGINDGAITYWLDNNTFEVYKGKNVGDEAFTNVNQISVNDDVIIYGKIKKYYSTYEFDADNYLVSHVKATTFSIGDITVSLGGEIKPAITSNVPEAERTIQYTVPSDNIVKVDGEGKLVTVAVGGPVTVTATLTAEGYKDAETTFTVEVIKALTSIEIETPPTTTSYKVGDKFDPTGLVITANYNNGSTEDVAYAGNEDKFTFTPSLETPLTTENTSVTITYAGKETTQTIEVRALDTYDITWMANGIAVTLEPATVVEGNVIGTLPTPDAENIPNGFDFAGWSSSESSTTTIGETYIVNANVTLYAVFSREVPSPSTEEAVTIIDGSKLTSTATTTDTYQTFDEHVITFSKGAKKQAVQSGAENYFTKDEAILIGKKDTYIYNTTPFDKITKFEVYANKGASTKVSVGINFSTSAISSYSETADNTWTETLSTVDHVYDASAKLPTGAKYFWYQVTNDNNSQVQFKITYQKPTTTTEYYIRVFEEEESEIDDLTVEAPMIIMGGYTLTVANDLTIANNSAALTIEKDAIVIVEGTLTNNGAFDNLVIKDGGQLIFNNSSSKDNNINSDVEATVEKVMDKHGDWGRNENPKAGWYFLAAPMTYFKVESFVYQAGEGGYDLYRWRIIDGTPTWYNYKAHDSNYDNGFETYFFSGRGYLAAYETTNLLQMQGTLNAGTTFRFTEELNGKGNFTLLGNPFTYDLKWSDFNMTHIYKNGCAFVNSTTGTIKYAVGDTTIKVGTGFMVYTEENGAELSFTKSNKSGKSNDILALNLFASNGNGEDNTIIVIDDRNGGFAKADNFNTNVPQIYTERLQTKYGIRNFSTNTKEFFVSFKAVGEGSNTIRLETIGEFDYVHLYDKLTDVDVDMLLEGSYTFEASEGDDTHRFIVRIDKGNTGIDENETENFVNVYNGEIHVSGSGEVQIFDVMGRIVHSEVISGDATISTGGFKGGVYVVRLIGNGWTKTEKIVVRR